MNLDKKGQFHFSFFKVDSQNPKFNLEYLLVKTKNLERLYNCLVGCLLACHAQNSSNVTLAFEDAD